MVKILDTIMDKFLKLAVKLGASYAEIASSNVDRTSVELMDKEVKDISSGSTTLHCARVVTKGGVGAAYSYKNDMKALVENALKNAKAVNTEVKFPRGRVLKQKIKTAIKIHPSDISLEEKKDNLLKLNNREKFPSIVNLRLVYSDALSTYRFQNTEGSEIEWKDCASAVLACAYSKRADLSENFMTMHRIKGGYEVMKEAQRITTEAMEKAEQLLDAKNAMGGKFDVIVDQKLGGVFTHEAVGHACEADHILSQSSAFVGKVGEKIGNEKVHIADDGKLQQWGWRPVDSEGVKGHRTVLVKDGVLMGFLHSRETAALFDAELTGNGRQQDLTFKVIPRMTTTFIENGDSSFDEMLKEVKKGYYLKGSAGGQVDPASGEFLFNALEGYYVENGEVKHMVKRVSLTGNVLETLHNIKLIAKDLDYGTGFCGKANQYVPVGDGAPHLLIKNAKLGGTA